MSSAAAAALPLLRRFCFSTLLQPPALRRWIDSQRQQESVQLLLQMSALGTSLLNIDYSATFQPELDPIVLNISSISSISERSYMLN